VIVLHLLLLLLPLLLLPLLLLLLLLLLLHFLSNFANRAGERKPFARLRHAEPVTQMSMETTTIGA
jgi:hypothetical protein